MAENSVGAVVFAPFNGGILVGGSQAAANRAKFNYTAASGEVMRAARQRLRLIQHNHSECKVVDRRRRRRRSEQIIGRVQAFEAVCAKCESARAEPLDERPLTPPWRGPLTEASCVPRA